MNPTALPSQDGGGVLVTYDSPVVRFSSCTLSMSSCRLSPYKLLPLVLPCISPACPCCAHAWQTDTYTASEDCFPPRECCCFHTKVLRMFCKTKITFPKCQPRAGPGAGFFHVHDLVWGRVCFMEISVPCRPNNIANKGFPGAKPQAVKD